MNKLNDYAGRGINILSAYTQLSELMQEEELNS